MICNGECNLGHVVFIDDLTRLSGSGIEVSLKAICADDVWAMVITGEATGDTIGVAFGTEWISAGVVGRVSDNIIALLAYQWMADPDGDSSTVWNVPDVCYNS